MGLHLVHLLGRSVRLLYHPLNALRAITCNLKAFGRARHAWLPVDDCPDPRREPLKGRKLAERPHPEGCPGKALGSRGTGARSRHSSRRPAQGDRCRCVAHAHERRGAGRTSFGRSVPRPVGSSGRSRVTAGGQFPVATVPVGAAIRRAPTNSRVHFALSRLLMVTPTVGLSAATKACWMVLVAPM